MDIIITGIPKNPLSVLTIKCGEEEFYEEVHQEIREWMTKSSKVVVCNI